jgi:hypothetical protein
VSESSDLFQELCITAMQYLVTVGLINSVAPQMPQHVQENLLERMALMRDRLDEERIAVEGFGEAFDQ